MIWILTSTSPEGNFVAFPSWGFNRKQPILLRSSESLKRSVLICLSNVHGVPLNNRLTNQEWDVRMWNAFPSMNLRRSELGGKWSNRYFLQLQMTIAVPSKQLLIRSLGGTKRRKLQGWTCPHDHACSVRLDCSRMRVAL